MSAFTRAPFATIAPLLQDFGYSPVPIKPGEKAPLVDDWQAGHPVEHYLPHRHPTTGRVTDCARWGTGILTATTPAIDVDVRDKELVRALIDLADDLIGGAPFRIGNPPKALLPFATDQPFEKIAGRWFGLPGEDWRAPSYSPHRVEVLGAGQQFVSYAIHPSTRRPYRWARGEPMQCYRVDLPELTVELARDYVAAAEEVLLAVGAVPLRRQNGRWRLDQAQPHAGERDVRRADPETISAWQVLDPETIAKKIDAKHAKRQGAGWICKCPAHHGDGYRSLSITPRRGGGSVVHCFAECPFPDISRAIADIVRAA